MSAESNLQANIDTAIEMSGAFISSKWIDPEKRARRLKQGCFQPLLFMEFPTNQLRHQFILSAHDESVLPSSKMGPLPPVNFSVSTGGEFRNIQISYMNDGTSLSMSQRDYPRTLAEVELQQKALEMCAAKNLLRIIELSQ